MMEIRCTDPFGKAGAAGSGDRIILAKRGTAILYFDAANLALPPNVSIQAALCARNAALSDPGKKKFFQAFYEDEIPSLPNSFEKKIAAITAVPGLSFLFANDITQKLLRGVISDEDKGLLILPGAVGAEANILAQRLDWNLLLDDSADVVSQRNHILQLKERLDFSRSQLAETAQGKLYLTRSELISVLQDPALKGGVPTDLVSAAEEIRQLERQLQKLREKDEELRDEQRSLILLSIKNDYESLLKLRQDLEDLESNASHYARSITGQGQDITVHELTQLIALYQDYRERETKKEAQREEVEKIQKDRYQWEQKRILSEYKVKQLQEKVAAFNIEQEKLISEAEEKNERERSRENTGPSEEKAIGAKHLLLLAGLALIFLALMLFKSRQIIAIICFVLAGLVLTRSAFLFARPIFKRKTELSGSLADSLRHPLKAELDNRLTEQLAEQTALWRTALAEADRLAANLKRNQIALHSLEESQMQAANEFLGQLSLYADIDNINDAEYVLDALRDQRQSESSYDKSVSELLRQIADVRKGRTDSDMLREYEHACEELYGTMLTGDSSENQNINQRSQALNYDKNRARRIEIERVELSQDISRHKQQLKEKKESLKEEEEFLAQTPKLTRRRDFLEQSLWQEIEDIELLDLAITVLDFLYLQWGAFPLEHVRTLTLNYSRRLQGMQSVEQERDDCLIEEQRGIRRGELDIFKAVKTRERELSLINNSPSDVVYLAFRMALLDWKGRDQLTPLLIFDLPLFNTATRINELLNLLDERMLDLSAQSIFFTSNNLLAEAARERRIPVHSF
jgi:hypothetical protein